jgi:predicted dehydrogenase
MYAARAGKDMYVEKPLSTSLAWEMELRKAVKRNRSVFQYGTQQRSSSDFRIACELARNGYIGEIKRVEAWCPDISEQFDRFHVKQYGSTEPAPIPAGLDYNMWLGPAPQTPYTVDRCTQFGTYHIYDYALGFIAGWGAHPLDIAQWGLGKDHTSPVYYEGSGEIPIKGLYDTVSQWDIHCRYADGLPMRFMSERPAKPVVMKYRDKWNSHGTTFFGTEGWVSVDRSGLYTSDPKLKKIKLKSSDIHLYNSLDHALNFINCIKSRAKTISPLESAIRSDTISHMSDICIRLNTPIEWDPKAEKITNNRQASRMLKRPMRSPWHL